MTKIFSIKFINFHIEDATLIKEGLLSEPENRTDAEGTLLVVEK